MSLYGIIFDWFFQYIWTDNNELGNSHLSDYHWVFGDSSSINMAEWLCHTCTIITLIAGCVLLFLMLKWLFKLFAGMISGVGR